MGVEPVELRNRVLQANLVALSLVMMDRRPIDEILADVAELAAAAVPGSVGAGVTMLDPGRTELVLAGTGLVSTVDRLQHAVGEGPGIDAVAFSRVQVSGSLGGERRWPRFGPRAGRAGMNSVMSLPLVAAGQLVGALNVYGHDRDAFGAEAISIGDRFSAFAAVTVANIRGYGHARRLADQLEHALDTRGEIQQAVGILMSRSGAGAEEALEMLRTMSRRQGVKLVDIAGTLVSQAVIRARARRS